MDPLLHLLQRDGRATPGDLAVLLGDGVSATEVQRRITDFETAGVILGYQAVVDHERAGEGNFVTAVIEIKVTPEREGGFDGLAARIAGFEQVRSCYLMSGGYDLLVVIDGRNLREVAAFVSEKLSPLAGVVGTSTHFRLKAYKENGTLLAKEPAPERLAVSP